MTAFFDGTVDDSRQAAAEGPLSVSEALAQAKSALESFMVRLVGEVSEVNDKPGYKAVYFTVKDDRSSLPCMMWLNRYQDCGLRLRVGMLVELVGRFTLYAPKGRMNYDVFSLSAAGEGDLRLRVAERAKKLEAEGLMAPQRKKAIPLFPQTIGLVTSPRGAAVHDVLRTLRRRFPLARVVLAGVPVEGAQAAAGLCEALLAVQAAGAELALLVRGGGSFEDLMPFNDEGLARTIAGLGIPVVTGIGHEPDTSIADMVADLRASTPTAAAEAVSPAPEAISTHLASRAASFNRAMTNRLVQQRLGLAALARRPLFRDPTGLFATEAQTLDLMGERLGRAIPRGLERDRALLTACRRRIFQLGAGLCGRFGTELAIKASRLQDLSPLAVLSRGYSLATDSQGGIVTSIHQVKVADDIRIDLSDGRLHTRVIASQAARPDKEDGS
jgi:exodeoxyribonuclease VII large subunit